MIQSQVFANALLSQAKVAGEDRRMERLKQRSIRKTAAKVIGAFMIKAKTRRMRAQGELHAGNAGGGCAPLTGSANIADVHDKNKGDDVHLKAENQQNRQLLPELLPSIIRIIRIQTNQVPFKKSNSKVWRTTSDSKGERPQRQYRETTSLQTLMGPLENHDFKFGFCLLAVM